MILKEEIPEQFHCAHNVSAFCKWIKQMDATPQRKREFVYKWTMICRSPFFPMHYEACGLPRMHTRKPK